MRRIILAATAGALLLTASACGTSSDTDAAAPATTTAAAVASPSADYTADTKKVCDDMGELLGGKKMEQFGAKLGEFIGYTQAKASSPAKKARTEAGKELKELATSLTKLTGAAQDPGLQAAGEETLKLINKSAEDEAFFAKFKTVDDVSKKLEPEVTAWLAPLDKFCA
ncbi:hypothetical protein [Actinoplanes regularis]|uniref:Uncharacterized protein n=1 Tax=Actinoplanes regularis TaxID=52697 RepID=A0A239KDB6_9ACTN|nr:hypothetical protein [Actinoplanes regularis]GIE90812.1 hypothetical protein Are01nite_72920 [Actinoplanes regularis]SNT15653.1 hypothetical protein SAMN06264365_1474 [Actinoplanes regularis]